MFVVLGGGHMQINAITKSVARWYPRSTKIINKFIHVCIAIVCIELYPKLYVHKMA